MSPHLTLTGRRAPPTIARDARCPAGAPTRPARRARVPRGRARHDAPGGAGSGAARGPRRLPGGGPPLPACDPLAALAEFVAASGDGPTLPFPLGANVVGVLGYELGRVIEP